MKLSLPHEQIAEFCRKWKVSEFALFGSVLRDDFRPDSDVDVLVTFAPDADHSLFDVVDMQEELQVVFGRKVDVVNRRGVEKSGNPFRKRAVLGSARRIYPATKVASGAAVKCGRVDRNPGLLYDMLLAARDAERFSVDITADEFQQDELAIAAMSQVLGEFGRSAGKVSVEVRERCTDIPWSDMAEFADRLLREYWDVDANEVWRKAQDAVRVIPVLEPLIPPVNDDDEEMSR